jgi:hypothetical protein
MKIIMNKLIKFFLFTSFLFLGCQKQSKEEKEILETIEWYKNSLSQKDIYDVEIYQYDYKIPKSVLVDKGKSSELIIKDKTIEFRGQVFELRLLGTHSFEYPNNSTIYTKAYLYFNK